MPVRSLSSSVFKWPDAHTVLSAVSQWAVQIAQSNPAILKVGCFGSYARGDWGVGSDVDILILLKESDLRFESRALQWDANHLPVPADVIVYTLEEWEDLQQKNASVRKIAAEIQWLFER